MVIIQIISKPVVKQCNNGHNLSDHCLYQNLVKFDEGMGLFIFVFINLIDYDILFLILGFIDILFD